MRAEEEFAGGDRPLPACRPDVDRGVEGDGGRRQLGPGRRERERAADGAAAARLQVADVARRFAQQRPGLDRAVVQQALLAHRGADVELAVSLLQHVEARDAVHVDERTRLRCSELHQLHEALAAREHLRAVALREQLDRLLDRLRRVVLERRRLHGTVTTSLPCAPLACRSQASATRSSGKESMSKMISPAAGVTDEAQIVLAEHVPGHREVRVAVDLAHLPADRAPRRETPPRLRTGRSGRAASRVLPPACAAAAGAPQSVSTTYVGPSPPAASLKALARSSCSRLTVASAPSSAARCQTLRVASRGDDMLGAEQLRRLHGDEPDRARRPEHEHAVVLPHRRAPRDGHPAGHPCDAARRPRSRRIPRPAAGCRDPPERSRARRSSPSRERPRPPLKRYTRVPSAARATPSQPGTYGSSGWPPKYRPRPTLISIGFSDTAEIS